MRTHSFWDTLVHSTLADRYLCTGLKEGFSDLLQQMGPRCIVEVFDPKLRLSAQPDLFKNSQEKDWRLIFIGLSVPHQVEVLKKLLATQTQDVLWIFFEKVPSNLPKDLEVLNIHLPSLAQWKAALQKFLPHFKGEIIHPSDLYQAARFLKTLALTGSYLGEPDVILEGTAWEKFEILFSRNPGEIDLAISDLSHIAYCLELIHQKAVFPGQWVAFIPKIFEQKMTKPFASFLTEKALPHYIQLLESIQNLDPSAGSRALAQWFYWFKRSP